MTENDVFMVPRRTSEDRLVRRIKGIERRVDAALRTPQLTSSSLDGGYIAVTDGSGGLTGIIGQQWDGANGYVAVNGPTPPVPNQPQVVAVPGGLRVTWDGFFPDQLGFVTPVTAPTDFARMDVEVSADPTFADHADPRASNNGSIIAPNGGTVTVSWPVAGQALYVRLRTRSTTGKRSDPSTIFGPIASGMIGLGDFGFNLANYTAANTIVYSTTQPANPDRIGTLWVKELSAGPPPKYETWRWTGATWQLLQDQGVTTALTNAAAAQTAADTKAKLFTQATTPSYSGAANTAYWIDTSSTGSNLPQVWNGSTWVAYKLGNGAIQPNSLVASNVIATGTVSAALLESLMVLTTTVVAGNATGNHARLDNVGLRVFAQDALSNVPNEMVRLGTGTSDYFAVVDSAKKAVASIDNVGRGTFSSLVSQGSLTVGGKDFQAYLNEVAQQPGAFRATAPVIDANGYGPIQGRVGVAEVNGVLTAGRRYSVDFQLVVTADAADAECDFAIHSRSTATVGATAAAPVVGDTMPEHWLANVPVTGRWVTVTGTYKFTAAITGHHRFLISLARGAGTGSLWIVSDSRFPVSIDITDRGVAKPYTGQFSQGSGAFFNAAPPAPPPAPVQQINTGWMAPAGWRTWGGSGIERTAESGVTGPIQGLDPSGYNGDGGGFWYWDLPTITGTVDEVWVWLYSSWWYYASGGTARLNIVKGGAAWPIPPSALTNGYDQGGFSREASLQVNISGWKDYFHSNQGANRAVGVSVGPAFSTDLIYYGRFDGPSARLGIRYTQ